MLSVHDVARQLKATDQHIRTLLRKGYLDAEMVGKQWVIQQAAVDQYIQEYNVEIEPGDHPRASKDLPEIVALSFFSGAMGLDIGMEQGGIHALLACEHDKACRCTINKNKPQMALIGDITKYSADSILAYAGIPSGRKVDIIFGGPPCQAFSTAGNRRGFDDTRGNVFLKYLDVIRDIRPTYVVIENVRGLLSAAFPYSDGSKIKGIEATKGGALLLILKKLRDAGYTVSFQLYNSANFGAPQIRERVVIIAHLEGSRVPYLTPTHSEQELYGLPKWKTLSDAFSNLPDKVVHHHVTFPEERLKFYRLLTSGQYWKNLPQELQKAAMGKSYYLGGGKTGFYRRLAFNKPSPTLVTHPAMPATDLAHPVEDRPLSVEEYKCIQEFPQSWEICGSIIDQYRQIGNAVPIALGKAIAKTIIAHMKGEKQDSFVGFPYSRYKRTDDMAWEVDARQQLSSSTEQLKLFVG